MPTNKTLDDLLVQLRRIEEHREKDCEAKVRKYYKELMKDLNNFLGNEYAELAQDDKLTFEILHSKGKYARFIEEVEQRTDFFTRKAAKAIKETVQTTYQKAFDGMVKAVEQSQDYYSLKLNLKGLKATTPDIIKNAVKNTFLEDALEKNHKAVIYDIKQQIGVGLSQGDRMSTMARRINEQLDRDYNKATQIVRTECHRVREAGYQDSSERINDILKDSDSDYVMVKVWKTKQDERVRPQQRRKTKKGWKTTYSKNGANHIKMHDAMVLVDEKFELPSGATALTPGQSGVASEDINCRCGLSRDFITKAEYAKLKGEKVIEEEQEEEKPAAKKQKNVEKSDKNIIMKAEETEKLDIVNFPSAFTTRTEKKNTQTLIDYVNNLNGANPDALKLYNSLGKLESVEAEGIPFKITHTKKHAVATKGRFNGELVEVKLIIPKLSGENLAGQVNTTLHEEMHLIDLFLRADKKKYSNWFSTSQTKLMDEVKNTPASMSDKVSELFVKFNDEYKTVRNNIIDTYNKKRDDLRDAYFPNGAMWSDRVKFKEYEKEAKKLLKQRDEELDYECRNIMGGGVGNLQDIYDALSGGTYRQNGTVTYGHGTQYYRRTESRVHEIVANYGSLSITRPDLIEMLKEDKPELVAELETMVKEMIKKAGG